MWSIILVGHWTDVLLGDKRKGVQVCPSQQHYIMNN